MKTTSLLVSLLAVALATAAVLATVPSARAADREFILFGDATNGWGATNTTIANPGPTISVDEGDNVTLRLNGTTNDQHNWYVDYDGDSTDDNNEPNSPNFRDTEIVWNFTADTPGTYTYRCRFHPTTMTGSIEIRAASTPPGGPGDNTLLIVGGIAAGFLILLVVATLFMRKKQAGGEKQ